jgi:hypothetical protein
LQVAPPLKLAPVLAAVFRAVQIECGQSFLAVKARLLRCIPPLRSAGFRTTLRFGRGANRVDGSPVVGHQLILLRAGHVSGL